MRRYLSKSKPSPLRPGENQYSFVSNADKIFDGDNASFQESTITATRPYLPSPNLKVKKVDSYFSRWSSKWKYRDSSSSVIPELRPLPTESKQSDDLWQQYCFVVIRVIPKAEPDKNISSGDPKKSMKIYFKIVVKSQYLLTACRDVMGDIPGVSWDSITLELDPYLLLTFLPNFQTYRDGLRVKETDSEENYVGLTVDVLTDYLRKDYRATLASIDKLTSRNEITFELLFAILVPRSIIITKHHETGEILALQLVSAVMTGESYSLECQRIDIFDSDTTNVGRLGRIQIQIAIPHFSGTVKINSLNAYPIQYHQNEEELRRSLITRGRKWASLCGRRIHHMYYKGSATSKAVGANSVQWNVNSRVMIDRANFVRSHPTYVLQYATSYTPPPPPDDARFHGKNPPPPWLATASRERRKDKWELEDLTDDDLLIASTILFGFSLSDKLWLEFNVGNIEPINWNETAFRNLVLPPDRKVLLQSLVEGHNAELGFDDFIQGKGKGLVVNLFGPPGVGKTLSAEATSEHVKRPLYVVGAGDLGTTASSLDQQLQRVFELAGAWKAIVLIDEADVFLEKRSLHDLERNALVAVFLRHLEYYPAILFLTTNRVKTFDPAFLSRIHIALHFQDLPTAARKKVWTAFLDKVGIKIGADSGVSEEELKKLSERDINGRQVKNATKTAQCLAASRGEALQYKHLSEALDVMEQFATDFERMVNEED